MAKATRHQEAGTLIREPLAGVEFFAMKARVAELEARVEKLEAGLARAERLHDQAMYQLQMRIGTFPWDRLSAPPAVSEAR